MCDRQPKEEDTYEAEQSEESEEEEGNNEDEAEKGSLSENLDGIESDFAAAEENEEGLRQSDQNEKFSELLEK